MASRYTFNQRSKEAPMDYEWTNRSSIKPAWATGGDDTSNTPRKRSHDHLNPTTPSLLSAPQQPVFGANQNVPFLFQPTPLPQEPQTHPWAPPPQFSPAKAFPELKDVDMSEASPRKNEETSGESSPMKEEPDTRPVATGGLRRVFKQRTKRSQSRRRRANEDEAESSSGEESEEEGQKALSRTTSKTTSNHYTLNMPAHPAPPSDTPYVLLGYLQFFFNLSLILIFLYLFVQFIITVQRDVQLRISEYSQDIIQEISMCALQFKDNRCAEGNIIPAMIQQCANWEACMNRDPTVVGRAKVGAELIAEVINGFVEPISWKTLIFTLTSLAFLTVFINTLLSLYRSKHQPIAETMHHPVPSFPIVPSVPHQYGNYLASGGTPGWGRYRSEEDFEEPSRRRRLEGGVAAKIK